MYFYWQYLDVPPDGDVSPKSIILSIFKKNFTSLSEVQGVPSMWEPEDREKGCDPLSSGQDTEVAIKKACTHSSCDYLQKTGPVSTPSCIGKGLMRPHGSLRD